MQHTPPMKWHGRLARAVLKPHGRGARATCVLALATILTTSLLNRTAANTDPRPAAAKNAAVAPTTQPFSVFPADVHLNTSRDEQSLVVRVIDEKGISRDVTKQAKLTLANPALAKIDGSTLRPVADGSTTLTVEHDGRSQTISVTVKDAAAERPISFKLDVEPVFMRAGCNTGGCHGAARGKDGFELSLFGYNPDADHHRLTREQPGRRINLALPEESLLLTKTTGAAAHTGGTRFKVDSEYYRTLLRWVEAGAPKDSADVATPTSLEIYPQQMVLEGEGATHQLTVRAKYSDGTDRDVTNLAVFMSSNDNSAKVTESGLITAGQRGEAFVMARFATFTVGTQAIVIPKDLKYEFPRVTENNYIDGLVNAKLQKLRIIPSEVCSDEVFIRRAYLDVVGLVPTREQFEKFVNDQDPKKREKLIDELLGRKEFVELWVMKWAELLQIRSNNDQMSYKATLQYYNWLQDKIARNVRFDKIVQEMLGATGGTFTNPAANFYQVERDTMKLAENAAQVFMGMRIQCAQCHNHPFDRWTQNDYYGFVSFFSQVSRKRGEDPRETIIIDRGSGEVPHPLTKQPVPPTFLGSGPAPGVKDAQGRPVDRREVLGKWLASPENPYFSRNLANIVWAHFLGKGIIDPVDDVRISNPPSNPELLDELARRFTEYNYDFKRLVRDICTSRTYQLSTQTNETNKLDDRNFSHAAIRRIRAEVALDVISQVTESHEKFRGLPLGARAVQIADGTTSNYFLTTFGRATRETVCSCEVSAEPNLSQAFHLLNGRTVNDKVRNGGVIKKLLDAKLTTEQVIEELYIRAFSRKPVESELSSIKSKLPAEAKELPKALEDIFWALLNSQEFIFNH